MSQAGMLGSAVLEIRASQDKLASDFAKIRGVFEKEVKQLQEKTARISVTAGAAQGLTAGVGGLLGAAGGLGITAALAAGSKAAADFEQKMVDAATTFEIFDKTSAGFDRLKQSSIELGASTRYSASEVADAYGQLGQAGFNATQAMAAMPEVLGLAAAGGMKVADAAEIASATMKNFGLAAGDLERINDSLAAAANKSAANMSDMGYALKYAAPLAGMANVELEDLLAVIAKMADTGIKGEMAGTSLRAMLTSLQAPTKEAKAAFDELGITIDGFGSKQGPKLLDILEQLQGKGASTGQLEKMFGAHAISGVSGLLRARGEDSARALADIMRAPETKGSAKAMAKARMDTTKGDLEQLGGSLESVAISVFQPINENIFRPAIQAATDYFTGISQQAMSSQMMLTKWSMTVKAILGDIGGAVGQGANAIGGGGPNAGGVENFLFKTESITANWGLAWEKMKVMAKIAIIEMQAKFTEWLTGAAEGVKLLGQNMAATFTTAVDPRNWGEGFRDKIAAVWNDQDARGAARDKAKAAGDKVRQDNDLGGWIRAKDNIDALQRGAVENRQFERNAPMLEKAAKGAWDNVMAPFAGGGGPVPVEDKQAAPAIAKAAAKASMVGLADLSKQIQTGLMKDDGKQIAKDQLGEQKDINKNLKNLPKDIADQIKDMPAKVV